MDFPQQRGEDRGENKRVPSSAVKAAVWIQLQPAAGLPSPSLAQLSSAGLSPTVPGLCLGLSVGGFSRDTRRSLHL